MAINGWPALCFHSFTDHVMLILTVMLVLFAVERKVVPVAWAVARQRIARKRR